jgi:hypothetical protein
VCGPHNVEEKKEREREREREREAGALQFNIDLGQDLASLT